MPTGPLLLHQAQPLGLAPLKPLPSLCLPMPCLGVGRLQCMAAEPLILLSPPECDNACDWPCWVPCPSPLPEDSGCS